MVTQEHCERDQLVVCCMQFLVHCTTKLHNQHTKVAGSVHAYTRIHTHTHAYMRAHTHIVPGCELLSGPGWAELWVYHEQHVGKPRPKVDPINVVVP